MYINSNKLKNYAKGVLKGCDLFENLVVAFISVLAIYIVDKFNLLTSLGSDDWLFNGVIISATSIGFILLIASALYAVKGKGITITDSFVEIGLFSFILLIVYTIISGKGFLELKITAIALTLIYSIALAVIRSNYFVQLEVNKNQEAVNNSSIGVYFKNFFKRHWVTVLISAIVGITTTILIDEADIYMKIHFNEKALEFLVLFIAVAVLGLIVLVKDRIEVKRCNLVDAFTFILLFGSLTLLVEAIASHVHEKPVAFGVAIVGTLVSLILFALLCFNTKFELEDQVVDYSGVKPSISGYFKKLFDNHHLGVIFAVCCFAVSAISFLESSNILATLMSAVQVEEWLVIAIFLAIIMLAFFIISYELPSRKVVLIDTLIFSLLIISLICLITTIVALKTILDLKVLLFFAPALVAIIFIGVRISRVREFLVNSEEVEIQSVQLESAITEEIVEKPKSIGVRKSYEMHLKTSDAQLKKAYEALRNALETYKIKSRITKSCENFSRTGITPSKVKEGKNIRLQVKLKISGKFIKAFMNLNPAEMQKQFPAYKIKDCSNKYLDQPTLIKVRSNLSIKRALELIDILALKENFVKADEKKGLSTLEVANKLKAKREFVNYAELYNDNDLTYMQKLGYEHIVEKYYNANGGAVYLKDVATFHKAFAEKIVISKLIKDPHRYVYDEVSLETLEKTFENGAVVTLENMRNAGIIKKNANYVTVKASEKLCKKLIVEANVIEPNAVAMLFIAGGTATRIVGE